MQTLPLDKELIQALAELMSACKGTAAELDVAEFIARLTEPIRIEIEGPTVELPVLSPDA